MNKKQPLLEGILDPRDFDFEESVIITDTEVYEYLIKKLCETIKGDNTIRQGYMNVRKKYMSARDLINKLNNESLEEEQEEKIKMTIRRYMADVSENLRKNDYFVEKMNDYFSWFVRNSFINLEVNISSSDNIIIQGSHSVPYSEFEFDMDIFQSQDYITIELNILRFCEELYINEDINSIISRFMVVIEHELVHGAQLRKVGFKQFITLSNIRKKVDSHEQYIGTPLEKPAWASTIATAFYYDADKDVNKAINNLKKLNIKKDLTAFKTIDDIVKKGVKEGDKKMKEIVKYTYLILMNIKNKGLDIKEITPKDVEKMAR